MDRRRRLPDPPPTPPPAPNPNPNPNIFRDLSNFRTPQNPNPKFRNRNPSPSPIFFTASKNTPTSSRRRVPSATSRRLKALELDQSRSARKVQLSKEKKLKSFARSITTWLNFLFENPKACGCQMERSAGEWRELKRQRSAEDLLVAKKTWAVAEIEKAEKALRLSLKDVCSYDDMRGRMEGYLSKKGCDEVAVVMSRVFKSIDEGRLRMKAHCPVVTDLALKEKATRVLMCYNPLWLRIALYIIFGGDSLLNVGEESGQDDPFMKMIIENQLFTSVDTGRYYAYNKSVEGVYRPGYFEALGNIILKRFLLIAIFLDKAKCESTLPIEYGIDGLDGGSPLLLSRNSHIKSSRQVIQEFLSDSMHGEGDLLAHLAILGCKVNYQQSTLVEYEFKIRNVFEDLQDGILLFRAIQLLKSDPSILQKAINPSDTRKKNLQNCNTVLQYLKQHSVSLSDEDGVMIVAEDIVNGDKELVLSILWNMFTHLQVPLLVDKVSLAKEIMEIKGSEMDLKNYSNTEMGLLLAWIQAICESKHVNICNFSSIVEGGTLRFLIDFYCKVEGKQDRCDEDLIRHFDNGAAPVQKIAFLQNITTMLGNFPEVIQLCDIVDQDACFDDRSVIILLVFLALQLIYRRNLDQLSQKVKQAASRNIFAKPFQIAQTPLSRTCVSSNKKSRVKSVLKFVSPQRKTESNKCLDQDIIEKIRLIQGWWRASRKRSSYIKMKSAACVIQRAFRYHLVRIHIKENHEERAATIIQSHYRGFTERKKYMKIKMAVPLVQNAVRAWFVATSKYKSKPNSIANFDGTYSRYLRFMSERHMFVRMKRSALLLQQTFRIYIAQRHHRSATRIQIAWKCYTKHKLQVQNNRAATTIQRYWLGWNFRKAYIYKIAAITEIQAAIRRLLDRKTFEKHTIAAIEIQRVTRGYLVRKRIPGTSNLQYSQFSGSTCNTTSSCPRKNCDLKTFTYSVLKLQRWWRNILLIKSRTASAILIQASVRGRIARRKIAEKKQCITIIQRWWGNILIIRREKLMTIIQSHVRGWLARRAAERKKHSIALIQSYWKGYLMRKDFGKQIAQQPEAYVDNDIKLLHKVVSALSELHGCKRTSVIRQACQTLDTATEQSQKCCEALVDAGAIEILLKQIPRLNRGIPDQAVLKHLVSTLRNIARYPLFLQALVVSPQAVEILFLELLRNKGEGFFHICELLKTMCATPEGLKVIHSSPAHLQYLVHDLERKLEAQKRKTRSGSTMDIGAQRLRVAADLMTIILTDK